MDDQEPEDEDIVGLLNFVKENTATKEDIADAECRLRARLDILYTSMNRIEDRLKRRGSNRKN